MKQFFAGLFEYSYHYNQKIADVFISNQDMTSEKAQKLLNHILNAHQIWNNRIAAIDKPFGVWDMHSPEGLNAIDKKNYEHSLLILDKYDLSETLNYNNTKGQAFENSIQDILFHVINHSTYHRAQIATELKQHNIEPPATDYIFFKR
ncbi:MAG: DinB family protein [Bacteroidota bacterium]